MRTPREIGRTAAASILAATLALGGCSDGGTTPQTEGEEATSTDDPSVAGDDEASTDQEQATASGGEGEADAAAGAMCATLAEVDIVAAFGGALSFGGTRAPQDDACVVEVDGTTDGAGLGVRLVDVSVHQQRVDLSGDNPNAEAIDLGQDALLVNNFDLSVQVDDTTALVVVLQAFFEGDPPPTDLLRQGVLTVAEDVLGRL